MDLLTHGFLPYAAATWMRRSQTQRVAAAVGGMAPDVDVLWAWTAAFDPQLYPLVHRGASHTLLGAPILALLMFALLRPLGRRWPRLGAGAWPEAAPALLAGALSHLALDMLTITGVPFLWPFTHGRWTLNWFFFSVPYMAVITLVLWVPVLRGRATQRWIKTGGIVLLVVLLLAGAVRYASFPHDHAAQDHVTPGASEWTWVLTRRNETGVLAQGVTWGRTGDVVFFAEPNRTRAPTAIDACLASPGARAWTWGQWGEPVADAQARSDGGWNVTIRDGARLWMDHEGSNSWGRRLFGTEDDRALRCQALADGSVRVERRAGFWG